MPKATIKSLEEQLNTTRALRDMDIQQSRVYKEQVTKLSAENDSLKKDKEWLQRMHSAILQSMHSFVLGRNH